MILGHILSRLNIEDFLRKIMAWENFGFYIEVEKYKKMQSEEERSKQAEKIFDEYLQVDAANELGDIDLQTREYIQSRLDNPTKDLFDEVSDVVIDSLANSTINDFLRDSSYISYVNTVFPKDSAEKPQETRRSIFPCI